MAAIITSTLSAELLRVEISLPAESLPCAVIPVHFAVRNIHFEPVKLLNIPRSESITVEITSLPDDRAFYSGPLAVSRIIRDEVKGDSQHLRLNPLEAYSTTLLLRCSWAAGKAQSLFLSAGGFKARFTYPTVAFISNTRTNVLAQSTWIEFNIVEPAGADRDALARVSKSLYSGLLLFPDDISSLSRSSLDAFQLEMDELLEIFPESYLAPYAALARAGTYQARGARSTGATRKREMERALVILDSLRFKTNFALHPEVMNRRLSLRTLSGLPDDASPPSLVAAAGAVAETNSPLANATRELLALRYDIRGFQRDNPTAAKEHLVKVMQLNDQRGFGTITTEEFDRRCAELLREYMTNFATPLSPEEWARRTEQYAREDAIRAAEEEKRNKIIIQKMTEELERERK
jgi:hypothetical protein